MGAVQNIAVGLVLGGWCFSGNPALAEKRIALVIGNGGYQNAPRLVNARNDADDITAALKRSGFETISGTDLDKAGMENAAIRFAREARDADVAMFYYSGHAIQFAGVNYLAPVDLKLTDEADLRRMVRLDGIVADVEQAKKLRVVVLDACRDNPLADELKRSVGTSRALPLQRGLAKIDAPRGMIVAYSTQAGQTADDGDGRNSPYTMALLRHIEDKEEIGTIFRQVSEDVYQVTAQKQLPELSLSIIGKFYLNGPISISIAPQSQPSAVDPCIPAESHWKAADSIGTLASYQDHVARFPSCAFADLAKAHIDALKQKAAAIVPGPSLPKAIRGGYDGEWNVLVSCAQVGNAQAYATTLAGVVSNGSFHAEAGTAGNPGWLVMDGKIGLDGKATLIARGLTGSPKSTLNNMKSGSPFGYSVSAKFDESSGVGKRNEDRPCTVTFVKR